MSSTSREDGYGHPSLEKKERNIRAEESLFFPESDYFSKAESAQPFILSRLLI
jgi:hypothetical protein